MDLAVNRECRRVNVAELTDRESQNGFQNDFIGTDWPRGIPRSLPVIYHAPGAGLSGWD